MKIRGAIHHSPRWLLLRITAAVIVAMGSSAAIAQANKWPDVELNGRIITVTHHGVPAAEVWVTDSDDKLVARSFADGDGYYQLRRLPAGALRVHARGEGMVPGSMVVATDSFVREATLMLQDAAPVHGIVTMADGTPAAGAAVIVFDVQGLPEPFYWTAEVTTDAAGAWRIEAAPLRPLRVRAFVAGYKLGEQTIPRERADAIKVVMPAERAKRRTVTVTGMPTDRPTVVHCISRWHRGGVEKIPRPAREVAVAADGTANVWTLELPHEMRVSAAGHRSMPIAIPCPVGVDKNLRFALSALPVTVTAPHTTIKGHLVDTLGNAIANVTVVAIEHDLRATPVVTAADGSFVLEVPVNERVLYDIGLLSRTWRLGDRRCKVGLDGITWQSMAAKTGQPVRLHATKAGTLRGTLIGANGTPLAAAKVELISQLKSEPTARILSATDAAGRIDFAGIPLGPYKLSAVTAGGHVGTATVKVFGDQEAAPGNLTFALGSELHGKVTDPNGHAVSSARGFFTEDHNGAAARIVRRLRTGSMYGRFAFTDREGNFRVPMVTQGDWVAGIAGVRNPNPAAFTIESKPVTLNLVQK